MFDTNAVKESFDRAAMEYDAHAELQREVRRQLISLAAQFWPEGSRVLDAGCGTGAFFSETETFDWRVIGLDVAPGMCKVARQHLVPVINSSVEAIPLGENIFDGVFSSLMLQWLDNPTPAFAEIARVLKPGCHVVMSTFVDGTLGELKSAFTAIDDAPHVSAFLPTHQIIKNAQEAGFAPVLARQVRIVETYPDTIALMRRLQGIGAANRHQKRRKGLMTSRQFAKLEQAHPRTSRGFPATWQTLYLVLQKTMTASFFITGTGTEIGKTLVTTALCWQLKERGFNVTALKPVVSGFDADDMESDSALILKSCGLKPSEKMIKTISPWQFAAPLAPNMAASKEKKFIVFNEVAEFCEEHAEMQTDVVLAESAGGIMTPLDDRHTMLDVMERLRWPVILVAGSYLGAISHTLSALEVLKTRRIPVAALVISESEKTDVSLAETVEGLSPLVPASIAIVKLPRARPQAELWKNMPNISWICAESREKKTHV